MKGLLSWSLMLGSDKNNERHGGHDVRDIYSLDGDKYLRALRPVALRIN
jgi:hypothetical protein